MTKSKSSVLCMILALFIACSCISPAFAEGGIAPAEGTGGIVITVQPQDACVSNSCIFHMNIEAEGSGLCFQWQYSKNAGVTWSDSTLASAKTPDFSSMAYDSYNGRLYRCRLTDESGSCIYSAAAMLTVSNVPAILRQPEGVTASPGETVSFSVSCTGLGLSYQWYYSTDKGASWKESTLKTAVKPKITFKASASMAGRLFRCIVKDGSGAVLQSDPAVLDMPSGVVITAQPADASAEPGGMLRMSVSAEGPRLSYQWQYSKNGGITWVSSTAASAKKAVFSCTASASYHNRLYRCIVTDYYGSSVTSETVVFRIISNLAVTVQPADCTVQSGAVFSFRTEATGAGLKYQWQYSKDNGAAWTASSLSCARTALFSCTASAAYHGRLYRCVITDACGNQVTTAPARLTVCETFGITMQPESVTVKEGEVFTMRVKASGTGLSYQWEYSSDGLTWTPSAAASAKKESFICTASAGYHNRLYRCRVTSGEEGILYTSPACLTVTGAVVPCTLLNTYGGIAVRWTAPASGCYGVARVDPGCVCPVTVAFVTGSEYLDADVESGNRYSYFVYTTGPEHDDFAAALTGTPSAILYLSSPDILSAENLENGVRLVWQDVPGAERYCILRKTGESGSWTRKGYASAASYTDTTVTAGKTYYYKIRCCAADTADYTGAAGLEAKITFTPPVDRIVYVSSAAMNLYDGPGTEYGCITIPYMTELRICDTVSSGSAGTWYRVLFDGNTRYFFSPAGNDNFTFVKSSFTYAAETELQKKLIAAALPWKDADTRYLRGDSSGIPDSEGYCNFDCSGFAVFVLEQVMREYVPTYRLYAKVSTLYRAASAYNAGFPGEYRIRDIELDEIRPGDFIFFNMEDEAEIDDASDTEVNHVGIYLGNQEFIHCTRYNWGGSGVYVMPLTGSYLDAVVAVRRFLPDTVTPADTTMYVSGDIVNVRSTTDIESPVLATLRYDTPVKLLFTDNEYRAYVEYEENRFGFISLSQLKTAPDADLNEARTVSAISIRLRVQPDASLDYITLYTTEEVIYDGMLGSSAWAKIRWQGNRYYLSLTDAALDECLTADFPALCAQAERMTVVSGSNLRSVPDVSDSSNILFMVSGGSEADVIVKGSAWAYIRLPDGTAGFISMKAFSGD